MARLDRLRAACARSRQEFCVSYGGPLDAGDQFSAILVYRAGIEQPWSRVDVQRNIVSIVDHGGQFVALSDEGDVYFVGESGDPRREKIPGAGIYSDDATGKGALQALGVIDGRLAACGSGGQVYQRAASGDWSVLGSPIPAEEGFTGVVLRAFVQHGAEVFLCGYADPHNVGMTEEMTQALIAQDLDRYQRLMNDLPPAKVQEGRAYRRDDETWRRLPVPDGAVLHDTFLSGTDAVWMLGMGLIAAADAGGLARLGFRGDDETLISGTPFAGQHVLASDFALHQFDGHRLTPLRPPLGKATPAPLKVQATDGLLYYFDTKRGIHRWDGTDWEEIKLPPALLAREFRGLPRPR